MCCNNPGAETTYVLSVCVKAGSFVVVAALNLLAISGHAIALSIGFFPAYVRSIFRRPIPAFTFEVVHPCLCVDPNDLVSWAMLLSLLL